MENKIKEINDLNSRINELHSFLSLAIVGNTKSKYGTESSPKYNRFRGLQISADVWTGSQDPNYKKIITNRDDIELCVNAFVGVLEAQIKNLKIELAAKLK